ncbi:PadR family transcriptional regulator [Subtercola sp. Z020]|nr:PadR family transcriptional regulator [Subtercola sp. Z020]
MPRAIPLTLLDVARQNVTVQNLTLRDYLRESSQVSSIRFYILGSLAQHGAMHGHQLRLLAEEEHVHLWTDISVGSLYGAIKRLAGEGLIDVVRVEREGNFPERQVYAISEAGREALAGIREHQLTALTFKPDPFDLALTRLDGEGLDAVPAIIQSRVSALEALLAETQATNARALPYLTLSETHAMKHREHRIRAELDWHRQLEEAVPDIVRDEQQRNDGGRAPLPTGHQPAGHRVM